eukprot:TRINITY_DN574_c0_g1_i1.p1 TRINITY_DN574_c0_g1~~TRINITY_DN574_c0_g1_i1.p1  ORF type:complete len:1827 (+),score=747.77 TRINITY_DN574_c0_g1_i1:557-5482(+)
MVSATDPVAVVSLLMELNAAKPLSTVIEAESLMNDGSAFVVFLIMLDFATGNPLTASEVVEASFRMALGGPALGLAFGIGFDNLLFRFCVNDPIVEIALTIASAYLSFWTAESTSFKTSGVLTVVTLGVYMGGYGKRSISPEIHEFMHHVWGFLSYTANTVLFVLSGAFTYSLVSDSTIGWEDWGYLGVLYLMVHVTRGLTIILLWPALSHVGYGMSVPRGIIVWYGGLRGAVGLILALLVSHEESIPEADRIRIQFLTAGLVALTIAVNGTTAGYLYTKLGLAESTKGHRTTLKLSVDYVETTSDKLADEMKSCNFWGHLVQEDISKEYAVLTQYRPHRVKLDGRPPVEYCTPVEMMKHCVVEWFNSQPDNVGRRVARVSHINPIGPSEFDAQFRHVPDCAGRWPPPIQYNLKESEQGKDESLRFTLNSNPQSKEDFEKAKVISARPIETRPHNVYGKKGRLVRRKFDWYPDFSHTLSKHKPSLLQKLFSEHHETQERPLLHDVREDLRRIIIVSVKQRYEEWREKRIICQESYGILEEATLFVEDEDLLWVSKKDQFLVLRGRYDLKAEFDRVLEAVGVYPGGALAIAMHEPEEHPPMEGESDGERYWSSRQDLAGRGLKRVMSLLSCFLDTDAFTNAYLHKRLRLAIHSLMFFKAAHQAAWDDIQRMWGALLKDGDEDDQAEKTMKEEEDDLNDCYRRCDEVVHNLTLHLPDLHGVISALHEDFIHKLMVVHMTESTHHCMTQGLLTDGDANKMQAAIRAKLKPFFTNQLIGTPAERIKQLISQSRMSQRHQDVLTLPEWEPLEEMMKKTSKIPVINKKSFWEIKFVSRLQQLATRDKRRAEVVEEEPVQYVKIDGKHRSGSFRDEASNSPFHAVSLTKSRTVHLSTASIDEDDLDEFLVGDAVSLVPRMVNRYKESAERESYNLVCSYSADLTPHIVRNLFLAERQQVPVNRKGWVRAIKTRDGKSELLVECNLVPVDKRFVWYPSRMLERRPDLFYTELGQKARYAARSRLEWAIRQVWFRTTVDRTRQQLSFRFPHLIEKHWMHAKMLHNQYVGTPWPWWGSVVHRETVTFTLKRLEEGGPDWGYERFGVMLTGRYTAWHVDSFVTRVSIRDKASQEVLEIPDDQWREPEKLILESHYGAYSLLPSSSHVPFIVGGTEYPTTDHFYQSSKYPDAHDEHREERLEYRRRIIEARSAQVAQKLGQDRSGPKIAPNWDRIRDNVMMKGIRAKFNLQHGLKEHHMQLLSTKKALLICVDKNEVLFDRHWSVIRKENGEFEGGNAYGKLLMVMREELRHILITESAVAGAIAVVLAYSCSRPETEYRVGEHVRVKQRDEDEWVQGIVHTVSHINGTVTVLGEGHPEPAIWNYVQPYISVSAFCPTCDTFNQGIATTEDECTNCGDLIMFPPVTHFFGYKYQSLATGAPVPPGCLVDDNGVQYNSIDHYYQASKFPESELRSSIIDAPTASVALLIGQARNCNPPMRSDWDAVVDPETIPLRYRKVILAVAETVQVRTRVMVEAIRMKFGIHDKIYDHHRTLRSTGSTYLLLDDREDNMSAVFWGTGPTNTGLNMYGMLLMAAREELAEHMSMLHLLSLAGVIASVACAGAVGLQVHPIFITPKTNMIATPVEMPVDMTLA